MSAVLCEATQIGDILTMSLPFGGVVLDDSGHPLVFVSAGIGITPMAGMLSHLVAAGSPVPVRLLHADFDEASLVAPAGDRRHRALPNASAYVWYERESATALPIDGVFHDFMDLRQVELPEVPAPGSVDSLPQPTG